MRFTRTPLADDLSNVEEQLLDDPSASPGGTLHDQIVEVLKTIYDPEIPVNIYELGLIYDIAIDPANFVNVKMTLTSPACPVAGTLPPEVEQKVASVAGVAGGHVELVWEPPWDMSKMSEAAKLQLNLM